MSTKPSKKALHINLGCGNTIFNRHPLAVERLKYSRILLFNRELICTEKQKNGEILSLTKLTLPAYGKINLSLDVLALRSDGYHELATVMQSIKLADYLTFDINGTGQINLTTSKPDLPTGQDNLVVRAARLLQERFAIDRGIDIFLQKAIPIAAGLGGGSSDAATTMRALNCLWGLGLTTSNLIALGSELGADVAFSLVGGTVLAQGIGDKLTLLPPVSQLWLVLVKPDSSLRAGDVYQEWDRRKWTTNSYTPELLRILETNCPRQLPLSFGNDLERAVITLAPEVEDILQELRCRGAINYLVSGSGPTVFGIVKDEGGAIVIAEYFRQRYRDVYVASTI